MSPLRQADGGSLLPPLRSFMISAAAATCIVLLAAAGRSASLNGSTDGVLVLYSNGRLLPSNVEGDRGLHQTIRPVSGRHVSLFSEFLDVPRFEGSLFEKTFAAYLHDKYALRPPAVIVAVSQEALSFLVRRRAELYPAVPIVHVGVDQSYLRSISQLPADVIGVPVDYSFEPTIEAALRWHPRAQRLMIVTGASARDRALEAQARHETATLRDRTRVEFLTGLPTPEVLRRLRELGDDAVVFTPGYFTDGNGRQFTPVQSVQAMCEVSSAPLYGPFSTFIGAGIVGGYLPSFEAMGRQAGEIVNELLGGAAAASLQLPEMVPQTLHVDWRQARRWGIDEAAIPRAAVVHFKPPTLLEAHRDEVILAAAILVLQTALIAGLLVERRRRRAAEETERTKHQELARASRFAMAGELTGAIAHEINQPLGAILSNADAAELILESDGDQRDELRSILADIRRDDLRASEVVRRLRSLLARHEVEHRSFDLGDAVRDVAPMLQAEARERGITFRMEVEPIPLPLVGDRIQLQQVLINLALNAMDAVADLPAHRRTVDVEVRGMAESVTMVVRDRGHGISPEHLPRLFESFFSTKNGGMGLGLSIARTLVEAQGGRIRVESNGTTGSVFTVELPRPANAAPVHEEHA
jgi:signal transduction histidine kinase